jgi:hypothetical protein
LKQRGKPSQAALQTLVIFPGKPPPLEPDPGLTEAQAEIWRRTLAALPNGWLEPSAVPVLVELCRRVCRAEILEERIRGFDPEWIRADGGIERLDKLLAMADREGRAVVACCRNLRLTPSAIMHAQTAGRRLQEPPSGAEVPWSRGQ